MTCRNILPAPGSRYPMQLRMMSRLLQPFSGTGYDRLKVNPRTANARCRSDADGLAAGDDPVAKVIPDREALAGWGMQVYLVPKHPT